jgi:hypothetical protein
MYGSGKIVALVVLVVLVVAFVMGLTEGALVAVCNKRFPIKLKPRLLLSEVVTFLRVAFLLVGAMVVAPEPPVEGAITGVGVPVVAAATGAATEGDGVPAAGVATEGALVATEGALVASGLAVAEGDSVALVALVALGMR